MYILRFNLDQLRTARPPAGDWTRDPGSLDERSTYWATEAVAVSLGASSVLYTGGNVGEI